MENDQDIDPAITPQVPLFLDRLEAYQRPPTGWKDSWQQTCRAEDSTAKIFLDESFESWFAYNVVKVSSQNQTTFVGKAKCHELISGLELSSREHRQLLAKQVGRQIKPDVKEQIRRQCKMPTQANKRQREHS